MSPVTITQDPDKPVEREVLAASIVKISDAFQALKKSGLNRDAIVVLLHDRTKIARKTINDILNALEQLKRLYTTL